MPDLRIGESRKWEGSSAKPDAFRISTLDGVRVNTTDPLFPSSRMMKTTSGVRMERANSSEHCPRTVYRASNSRPGSSMTFNLPLIMSIACTQMKMTCAEALCACTINPAYAVGLGDEIGSIEEGKAADLVIWDAPDYRHIPYVYGVNLVHKVIKAGKIVSEDPDARRHSG